MDAVRKDYLVDNVSARLGCSRAEAQKAVTAVLEGITDVMSEKDKLTLTGFGTFEVRSVAPRRLRAIRGHNAGEMITVPQHKRIAFVTGKGLKDAVNGAKAPHEGAD